MFWWCDDDDDDDESLIACRPEVSDGKRRRLCLAKIPNTYFYHDSRPELRTIKVTNVQKTRRCPSIRGGAMVGGGVVLVRIVRVVFSVARVVVNRQMVGGVKWAGVT